MASKIPSDYTYNGLNYQEWIAEGRDYWVENGSLKGWENRFWIRPDGEEIELYSTKRGSGPKKTPDDVLAVGGHMKPRKTSVKKSFVSNRKAREEVPERLRERFDTDAEFEEYKEYVKKGNIRNQRLSSQAGELGTKFNKGHIVAVGAGGSHDPMAQRLESEAGNKSTQNIAEIPSERLAATGTPRNWDEAVTLYQNPDLVPTELTPKDKQRIWSGEDPDVVFGQRQTMIDQNPLARPNANRVSMLQPMRGVVRFAPSVGLAIGANLISERVQAGDFEGAAGEGVAAVVGEVPIAGDILVTEAEGRAAGTGSAVPQGMTGQEYTQQQVEEAKTSKNFQQKVANEAQWVVNNPGEAVQNLAEAGLTTALSAGKAALDNPMLQPYTAPLKALGGVIKFFNR